MYGMTKYTNVGGPVFGAVEGGVQGAAAAAKAGNLKAARQQLATAAQHAQKGAADLKRRYVALAKSKPAEAAAVKAEHNKVIELYHQRIVPGLQMFDSTNPYQAAAGYYPLGGQVVAPPKAGQYLFVPFEATVATRVPIGTRFESVPAATAAATTIVMRSPQLSWLKYRVRSLLIHLDRDAAAANDSIGVEDFRILGGPTLLTSENPYPAELFRQVDTQRVGLRYNGVVTSPNQLELTIRGQGLGLAQATAGNTIVSCAAVVEVIEDDIYGTLNNPEAREAFRQGQGPSLDGGYTFPEGTPVASTLERIQMVVETADALNGANARFFQMTNAVNSVNLISDTIGYADNQVVGIEIGTPTKSLVTDQCLITNIRVGGDAQLPAAEGEQNILNFLGDEGGALGGGAPVIQGLRHYPNLSQTNNLRATLQSRIGTTGVAGMTGARIVVPYVALLVNRVKDDVLGAGVGAPFAHRLAAKLGC